MGLMFSRNKFRGNTDCTAAHVLGVVPYHIIITTNYVIFTVIIVIKYTILVIKLHQRKKQLRYVINRDPSKIHDVTDKVTRATFLSLGAYIVLILPTILVNGLVALIRNPYHAELVTDAAFIIYFMNNMINPFIYFCTLRDFKDGYQQLSMFKCAGRGREEEMQQSQQTQLSTVA